MMSLSETDKDKLNKWIGSGKKRYTLLYSALKNGCDPAVFHTQCDNKGPTVTLVYNVNGNVYGGYSRVSWMSEAGESVYDGDAFLFLLVSETGQTPCKFSIKTPKHALTMDKTCGPVFGKSPDFRTFKGVIPKGTESLPLNSEMVPGAYQISEEMVTDITGGKYDATELTVYAVEDVAEDTYPWREMDLPQDMVLPTWNPELLNLLKKDIEEYWPLKKELSENEIPYIKILLLGPVGAGKSSFFNTINSFFRERLTLQAEAGSSDTSLTKSFNVYRVISNTKPLRFRICDCRGFEDAHGVDLFDIESILDGNVKNKYTFGEKPHISKESAFYRRDPKMHDRIHCVAIVVDSNNDPDYPMTDHVQEQIKKTQELMNQKGVKQLILMNKIDGLSETVRGDLSRVFYSPEVSERVVKLSHSLRLPPNTVLPMKNIEKEQRINTNISILALYNLRQMLRAADDYLLDYLEEFQRDKKDKERRWFSRKRKAETD